MYTLKTSNITDTPQLTTRIFNHDTIITVLQGTVLQYLNYHLHDFNISILHIKLNK
jgi:hypothetical protein